MMLRTTLILATVAALMVATTPSAAAWVSHSSTARPLPKTQLQATTRADFMRTVGGTAAAAIVATFPSLAIAETTLPNGVSYEVIKSGDGPKPEVGELVAIRFAAYNGDIKIDDIFDTPEPYYTRLGSGGLIKGVEQTLPLMRLGDRWKLTVPGNLAFGPKGRPASAGKPRIPANAVIVFEVEMVGLPGKEPELIELIGD